MLVFAVTALCLFSLSQRCAYRCLTPVGFLLCTVPCHTVPYNTTPHHITPYHTIQYHIISYHTYRTRLYNSVLDENAPLKRKHVRGDQLPWITPSIQREISYRNRLFKLHKRNPTQLSWKAFRKQRNKITSLKRKAMKTFLC